MFIGKLVYENNLLIISDSKTKDFIFPFKLRNVSSEFTVSKILILFLQAVNVFVYWKETNMPVRSWQKQPIKFDLH